MNKQDDLTTNPKRCRRNKEVKRQVKVSNKFLITTASVYRSENDCENDLNWIIKNFYIYSMFYTRYLFTESLFPVVILIQKACISLLMYYVKNILLLLLLWGLSYSYTSTFLRNPGEPETSERRLEPVWIRSVPERLQLVWSYISGISNVSGFQVFVPKTQEATT